MEKQGGIYARYSPGRDRDQTSTIEAQVAMCCEKAQRDGVEIDSNHIYVDGGSPVRVWCGWGFRRCLPSLKPGTSQKFSTPRTTNSSSETSAKQEADAQIRVHSQPLPKLPNINTFRD